jgi:hypothetical protein
MTMKKKAIIAGTVAATAIGSGNCDPQDSYDKQLTVTADSDSGQNPLDLATPVNSVAGAGGETNVAGSAGQPAVMAEAGMSGDPSSDTSVSEAVEEIGKVYLILPECHTEEEIQVTREAVTAAGRTPMPFTLEGDGEAICLQCPKGRMIRFIVASQRYGEVQCEVTTSFNEVAFPLGFTRPNEVFAPFEEGEGL